VHIDEYKAAVGKFPTGVTVISTNFGGEMLGFTANSFTSVSLNPPIVSFCLDKKAGSLEGFKGSTHFAVNILASDQKDISMHFASKVKNKFEGINHFVSESSNCPILQGVASYIECKTQNVFDCGDHFIFTGQALAVKVFDDKAPLIYFARNYHVIPKVT
jgi:flavin reductase (DIM6/NTAB) family NADH-FMN oxidoreductase RutF